MDMVVEAAAVAAAEVVSAQDHNGFEKSDSDIFSNRSDARRPRFTKSHVLESKPANPNRRFFNIINRWL